MDAVAGIAGTEAMELPANIVAGPNAFVLQAVTHARVGLALWWRALCPALEQAAEDLLAGGLFEEAASGLPEEAVATLMAALPEEASVLRVDVLRLARLFGELAGSSVVRLRFEHVADRTCPELHVDAVRLRLLCTYGGRGTEWQDARGTVRRMPPGHVGVFKGTRWLGGEGLVRHRSPAIDDARPADRHRLVLVVDEAALN